MNTAIPGPEDLYLFHEGNLHRSYKLLGAHVTQWDGTVGVRFAVWALTRVKFALSATLMSGTEPDIRCIR